MSVWRSPEFDDHEQICFFTDPATSLKAIVAIHSTFLGPAAGGTRFKSYLTEDLAIDDALRLSRAMSYKSALAGMPVGGGKAVIVGEPGELKTRELLHSFGRFIDRIGHYFATGEDVGVSVADIDAIREVTPFVGGTSNGAGDPAVHTAAGMLHGLRAVLGHKFARDDFSGLTFAIQGLGAVGWRLAELLTSAGAKLIVSDVRGDRVADALARFGAVEADIDNIHKVPADIFSPCALGAVITEQVASEISAAAVAGAANNQLATPAAGQILAQRNILFAPDYVLNAGGIISGLKAATEMPGREAVELPPLSARLAAIQTRLSNIFDRAQSEARRPEEIAEAMARELIGR